MSSRGNFSNFLCLQLPTVPQDYEGPEGDFASGKEYFRQRFVRLSNKSNRQLNRDVYTQFVSLLQLPMRPLADKLYSFTTATNTNMLKVVMTAVEGQ